MSTARQPGRPGTSCTAPSDRPTEIIPAVPVRRSILHSAASPSPFAGRRDQVPTELLPVTRPSGRRARGSRTERPAHRRAPLRPAPARDSTPTKPTGSREALDSARGPHRSRTKGLRRRATHAPRPQRHPRLPRHLRAALAGIVLAVALLGLLSGYAAQGIADARQAAPAQRDAASETEQPGQAPSPRQPAPTAQPDWVTQDTHAPYNRTDPDASPLDLPRCTTSPDTPLPCLATLSPSQTRAVVLEEGASLTALVRH